ncbi:MAG: Ig-like domain-containing protein [Alistipes sp.]|jgi:hypothetical protein|nr:Ig-like domain-containing protein [Alistipes sp.]
MKNYFAIVAVAVLALAFTGCKDEPTPTPDPIAVTGVTVAPTTMTLEIGAKQTIVATVAPSNATNQAVSWKSTDDKIATVAANGEVTAVAEGTTTITVTTTDGGKTATTTVTVNPKVPEVKITSSANLAEVNTYKYSAIKGALAEDPEAISGAPVVTVTADDTVGSLKLTLTSSNATVGAMLPTMGFSGAVDLTGELTEQQIGQMTAVGIPTGADVKEKGSVELDFTKMFGQLTLVPGGVELEILVEATDVNEVAATPATLKVNLVDDYVVSVEGKDFDITEPMEIKQSESEEASVVIDVYAGQGIENFIVKIETESEAFKAALALVGITGEFDLANPGDAAWGTALGALGVPVGDAIKGKDVIPFDISAFIGMIFLATAEEGDTAVTFAVKVVDTAETSAEAALAVNFVKDGEPEAPAE